MKRRSMGRAPDYTVAALVTAGITLFCLLFAIWIVWGYGWSVLVAAGVNGLLRLAEPRHGSRPRQHL